MDAAKCNEVMFKIERVARGFEEFNKKPRDYGTGDLLFPSEMSVIKATGETSSDNITKLSNKLGVSKSAVSQIVKKLEKKKYIRRYKSEGNNKEVLLELLDKGTVALRKDRLYHNTVDAPLIRRIMSMTVEQGKLLDALLDEMVNYVENRLKDRT